METIENKKASNANQSNNSNNFKNSVTLKLGIITALMLLLLLPTSMVKNIIAEREMISQEAVNEVSHKWADAQTVSGPILTIPVVYEYTLKDQIKQKVKQWNILPNELNIDANIEPEKLERGIFEVVVYNSKINIQGNFDLQQKLEQRNLKEIRFEDAFLTLGVQDLRGIKNNLSPKINQKAYQVNAGSKIPNHIASGVHVDLENLFDSTLKKFEFDYELDLRGSKNISFIPVGKKTNVKVKSPWDAPSFNGNYLPDTRNVETGGFTAEWNINQLSKSLPQSWIDGNMTNQFAKTAFGVDLILPVDNYQKATRSVKYAVLTIALTFLIFFLVEVINKTKIHPFQYALVGLALCLFYTLLISISEHTNFNIAFGLSTLGIVTLITLYSISVFKSGKYTLLLTFILTAVYTFLFTTLQLTDYALLMGSIGLLVMLAATMYSTRNINWYNLNFETK